MTNLWFTSDWHIGHVLVANMRGFETAEEHDAELARRYDKVVRPDDTVWFLGDLTLGSEDAAFQWVERRPGKKRWILGNHDKRHPMHRNAPQNSRLRPPFEYVATMQRIRVAGEQVLLSHMPYSGDRDEGHARYEQYRLVDCGVPLLHGHTHTAARLTYSTKGTLQFHVGPDAWDLSPISLHSIQWRS